VAKHVSPWSLWPLQEAPIPQEKNEKEIQCGDIGAILTFLAKCFQILKHACSLTNVQHKVLNKSFVCFINILVRVYWPKKKNDCKTCLPNPFLPMLSSMIYFKNLYHHPFTLYIFSFNKQMRMNIINMCYRRSDAISFSILDEAFFNNKVKWFRMLWGACQN
jgi:hypothetical protein